MTCLVICLLFRPMTDRNLFISLMSLGSTRTILSIKLHLPQVGADLFCLELGHLLFYSFLAQKLERASYANTNLRSVHPSEEEKKPALAVLDLESPVEQLRKLPEPENTLAALLSAAPGGR